MQCDECNKLLTEDDTNESILCTTCMSSREKLHCIKCKCNLKAHFAYKKVSAFFGKQKKALLVLAAITFIISAIFPFYPTVALKLAIGTIGLPIGIFVLIFVICCLTYGVFDLGKWMCKKLDLWDECFQNEVSRANTILIFAVWFFGVLGAGSPFISYGIGTVLYNLIIKH